MPATCCSRGRSGSADGTGRDVSMMQSAVFGGIARDCAAHLPAVLDNLAAFSALYERARFVFAVSDCRDATEDILERWLRYDNRRGVVLRLGALEEQFPKRTERIAHVRNRWLEAVSKDWADHEHLVVADLDDVLAAPVPVPTFAAAAAFLDGAPERAGVFANALPRYYDIWALRHDRWCPHDCWHPIWGRPPQESFEAAKFREVFSRQIALPADAAPVELRSAFGGLAIYRLRAALDARYRGLDDSGRETSEHVAFNTAIRAAGGRLHIFPALQVHAPTQHLYRPEEFPWRWRLEMARRRLLERGRPAWRRLLMPA